LPAGAIATLRPHAAALGSLGRTLLAGATDANTAADSFAAACGLPPAPPALPPEQRLGSLLHSLSAANALRAACTDGTYARPTICPRPIPPIANRLFPGSAQPEAEWAATGLVTAAALARTPEDDPLLPQRIHLFFRSIQGVWACSDPACAATARNDNGIL